MSQQVKHQTPSQRRRDIAALSLDLQRERLDWESWDNVSTEDDYVYQGERLNDLDRATAFLAFEHRLSARLVVRP
jgi:hypothetical protein